MKKNIKNILIAMIIFIGIAAFGNYASNRYSDVEKIAAVNNIYAELGKIKSYHFDNNSLPPTPESVGINSVRSFTNSDVEKSASFTFERHVEITSNEVVVSFGPGLEGDSTRTLILRPPAASAEDPQWSCSEGTLSRQYRPEPCWK